METLFQDVRYAIRMLRKSPGFTTVAVITLALGIGANTAIFTIVNALLLKMLPVSHPEQLVSVGDPSIPNTRSNGTPRTDIFSYPLYKVLRDNNSVFTGLCAAATDHHIELNAAADEASAEKITGRMISGNYFSVLGLQPAAGRLITESDDTAENANPVVVLGYGFWQRRFAMSPSIIGSDIRLNGFPFTVIGVAPPGFDGEVVGEQMALFVPISMQPEIIRGRHFLNSGNVSWLTLMGRLKSGINPAHAAANLNIVFQQALKGSYGAALSTDDRNEISETHMKIDVAPGGMGVSDLRTDYKLPLLLLMGIVGLVLLIACVNVANLLIARATARRREIAVRLAVGANWGRLLRQLLTESILLALLGGIAGSLLAVWGVRLLVTIFGSDTTLPLRPDARVLTFTIFISLVTGLLFGLIPALRAMRVQVSPALKESGRSTPERSSRFGLGKGLIAGQVALSLLVLFAASLLVRSLQKLMAQDFGYDRDRLVIARIDPISAGYDNEKMKLLASQLVAQLASTPGVHAVTYSSNGLFAGTDSDDPIIVPGFNESREDRSALEDYVGPDYFGAVGIPILAGRGIEARDTATSNRVAVVNEAMVKHFFHGQNPIGRQFRIDDADWQDKPLTIVGISRDAKDHSDVIRVAVKPRFYMAYQQVPKPVQIVLEAQIQGFTPAAVTNVTSQIKAVDANLPISFVKTVDTLVSDAAGNQIALARLSVFFGILALLLACVGLYGVMSYTVAGRSREIGVRMALGAARRDVVQMLLREGMLLVVVGVAVGIPIALASSQILQSFLFGLKATDPISLIGVILLLGAVAALAAFLPARRGSKIDPMIALRYE
ncbi:MAG: ABC transporter permease [Acidobacteriaceae bacterium]|nr:ABC transporter permease [Acidobacteriaceae bacterium]